MFVSQFNALTAHHMRQDVEASSEANYLCLGASDNELAKKIAEAIDSRFGHEITIVSLYSQENIIYLATNKYTDVMKSCNYYKLISINYISEAQEISKLDFCQLLCIPGIEVGLRE